MKSAALMLVAGLSLVACQKKTVKPAGPPADIEAAFSQDFKLHYQQQVRLPSAKQPVLTVQMTELSYSYCPAGANCFAPDFAWPTLRITDAQGKAQDLRLPANAEAARHLGLLDTVSVVAAGRRYALVYSRWELERKPAGSAIPGKADYGLRMRLAEAQR